MDNWINFDQFRKKYLKVPVEEFPNNTQNALPEPDITVILITYQHKNFIINAIESILMQKTKYSFELIIGDDESSDGTTEICKEYAINNNETIRLFLHKRENNIPVLGKPSVIFQFAYNLFSARGKYIAFLSGDDYWTDKLKLEKQTSFLNTNPHIILCYHEWATRIESKNLIQKNLKPELAYMIANTWMFRNCLESLPNEFLQVFNEDEFLKFILLTHGNSKFLFSIKETIYRKHDDNIWQGSSKEIKLKNHINTTSQILNAYKNTKHEASLKKILLKNIVNLQSCKSKNKLEYIRRIFIETSKRGLLIEYLKYYAKVLIRPIFIKIKQIIFLFIAFIQNLYWNLKKVPTEKIEINSAYLFNKCKIHPYSGLLITKNNNILVNSAFSTHKIITLVKLFPRFIYSDINTTVTSIEHGPWDNYYHWFIDSLPRIWGLWQMRDELPINLTLLLSRELISDEQAILESLLPTGVKIKKVEKKHLFQVTNFIFLPFLSKDCSASLPSEYLDFYFKQTTDLFKLKDDPPRKIFISRKAAIKRKFSNQDEVEAYFESQGFQVLVLEEMSIAEQAQWFYNSELVIGQHGAGFTNLLYSRFANVIEIFSSPNNHLNHYRDLCTAKNLSYLPVYLNGQSKNEDEYCDLEVIENAIRTFNPIVIEK